MNLDSLLHWIKETSVSQAISESDWLFPTIESAHVIAIALVVGTIAVVDLRLLGIASRGRTALSVTRSLTPLTWVAFTFASMTGLALFVAKPVTYGHNGFFIAKMAMVAAAGVNMAAFHLFVEARQDLAIRIVSGRLALVSTGDGVTLGRVSGFASLIVWTAVVTCGRWIGFTI